jgi:hypothetical protein
MEVAGRPTGARVAGLLVTASGTASRLAAYGEPMCAWVGTNLMDTEFMQ